MKQGLEEVLSIFRKAPIQRKPISDYSEKVQEPQAPGASPCASFGVIGLKSSVVCDKYVTNSRKWW